MSLNYGTVQQVSWFFLRITTQLMKKEKKTGRFVTYFYSIAVVRIAKKSKEWAAEAILKSAASIIIKSLIYL